MGRVTTASAPPPEPASSAKPQPARRQTARQIFRPAPAPPRKRRRFSCQLAGPGRPQPWSVTVSCQASSARHRRRTIFPPGAEARSALESRWKTISSASSGLPKTGQVSGSQDTVRCTFACRAISSRRDAACRRTLHKSKPRRDGTGSSSSAIRSIISLRVRSSRAVCSSISASACRVGASPLSRRCICRYSRFWSTSPIA